MNKKLLTFIAIIPLLVCGCKKVHKHSASEGFEHDETYHWHLCNGCDEKLEMATHEFEETIIKDPTCIEDGSKKLKCKVCDYEKIVPLNKLDHEYSLTWSNDETHHWHTCKHCDDKLDYAPHIFQETILKAPSCTEQGSKKVKCVACNYEAVVPIDKLDHKLSDTWSNDNTHHWHTCSDCTEKIDYAEHDYDEGTIIENPTFEKDGSIKYVCKTCKHEDIRVLPKEEHNYDEDYDYDDENHWHNCLDEGYDSLKDGFEPHEYTCSYLYANLHQFKCKCGKTFTAPHEYILNEDGVTATCKDCKDTIPYLIVDVTMKPLVAGEIACEVDSIDSNIPFEEFGVKYASANAKIVDDLFSADLNSTHHSVVNLELEGKAITEYNFYLCYENNTKAIRDSYSKVNQTINIEVRINGYATRQISGMGTSVGFGFCFSTSHVTDQTITDVVLEHSEDTVTSITISPSSVSHVNQESQGTEYKIADNKPTIAFGTKTQLELIPCYSDNGMWLVDFLMSEFNGIDWSKDSVDFTLGYNLGETYYALFEFKNDSAMTGFGIALDRDGTEVPTIYMSLINDKNNRKNGYVDNDGNWVYCGANLTLKPSYSLLKSE